MIAASFKSPILLCLAMLFLIISVFVLPVSLQTIPNAKSRIVFAVIEEETVNLYSSKIDGTDRKLLLSDRLEAKNLSAAQAVYAAVSPAGDSIAYTLPRNAGYVPLYVMNADGSGKRKVADRAMSFDWSPDGKMLLYSLLGRDQPKERTFSPFGSEWHLLDLQTKKDEVIAVGREGFQYLSFWSPQGQLFFIGSSFRQFWLYRYDPKTKRTKTVRLSLPNEGFYNLNNWLSPSGRRRIIVLASADYTKEFCDIYELNFNGRRGRRLIKSPDYRCTSAIRWNGDNEFFFAKGTGLKGKPDVNGTNQYGQYIFPSVYKYSFTTGREELIIESRGSETYLLEDVIKNKGLIVTSFDPKRTPKYILEFRKTDGREPVKIYSGDKAFSYIGQIKSDN